MLNSKIVQHQHIFLPPWKSHSISPACRPDMLNHFRVNLTSVAIKCVSWIHVVGERHAIKHGGLLVVRVVMNVWLCEPNFAACNWMSRQWWEYIPVIQISSAFLPLVIELFSFQVFLHLLPCKKRRKDNTFKRKWDRINIIVTLPNYSPTRWFPYKPLFLRVV